MPGVQRREATTCGGRKEELTMDHIDNAKRARNYVAEHIICTYCNAVGPLCPACGDAAEHLERLLNESEDRGRLESERRGNA